MKREKGPGSVVGKLGGTPESPGRLSKRRHPGPTPGAGDEAGASAACLLFFLEGVACHLAMWDLSSRPGIKPMSPALEDPEVSAF